MRIRCGVRPEDWRDVGPGYAGSIPIRGSLVTGDLGRPPRRDTSAPKRETVAVLKARAEAGVVTPPGRLYATDEERIEARRRSFREAKRRTRERQRAERSKVRAEIATMRAERVA